MSNSIDVTVSLLLDRLTDDELLQFSMSLTFGDPTTHDWWPKVKGFYQNGEMHQETRRAILSEAIRRNEVV